LWSRIGSGQCSRVFYRKPLAVAIPQMDIRHQLAAYSPVSAEATLLGAGEIFRASDDARPQLRALLEEVYGSSVILLSGSGTQALTIALRMAKRRVDPSAPVALPAFACFDVASAAVGADTGISFYDLDPDSLAPDLPSLERVLRAGARVVVVAPLYGIPVDWPAIVALASQYDAILVEDAAQGHGATWEGSPLGALGEIATLSFGRAKGWTGGNGGATLLRTVSGSAVDSLPEPAFRHEAATAFGLVAQWALARPDLYAIPLSIPALRLGQTTYRTPRIERSMTRVAAATLLATHEASRREATLRQANATKLLTAIAGNSEVRTIPVHREATAGYLRLPVRLSNGMEAFRSRAQALSLGIAPSYPRTLAELPQVASRIESREQVWPGAQTLVRELVTLPTHSKLQPRELVEITDLLTGIEC
jgi:dTDP-4-amino-4,6-dideoxygalactose transaminase